MLGLWIRFVLLYLATLCATARFTYMINERPTVTYVNHKYIEYANYKSQRFGRTDPYYYVSGNVSSKYAFGNNVTISFIFYELLSNQYKRSFVEMHIKLCDIIEADVFFGVNFKQGKLLQPCPYPAGVYSLYNMTIKRVPSNFPFRKGRIWINFIANATGESVITAHIDMEIKESNRRPLKHLY